MKLSTSIFEIYKKIIFLLPPEKAHEVSLYLAEKIYSTSLKRIFKPKDANQNINIMGINFLNKFIKRTNNLDYVSKTIKDLSKDPSAKKIFDAINESEIKYFFKF